MVVITTIYLNQYFKYNLLISYFAVIYFKMVPTSIYVNIFTKALTLTTPAYIVTTENFV